MARVAAVDNRLRPISTGVKRQSAHASGRQAGGDPVGREAVFNVQRSALLIGALTTGTTTAFPAALEDRLHQPYRAALVPGLDEIVRLRAPVQVRC